MKKQIWKRSAALVLAFCMVLLLCSCTTSNNKKKVNETSTAGEGKIFTKPTEISIVISSHSSWPYNENWKFWKYFQEATGATFKITAIPSTDVSTKVSLMMADKESLPDLLHLWEKENVDKYALSGAYVSLTENLDKLPHFTEFFNRFSEEERNEIMAQRTSGDGQVYSPPCYGTHTINNMRTWMYRKDIFDKNGLKPPTTYEELYQTAKTLKKLYPNSYPLCFRTGIDQLDVLGPSWKNNFTINLYYDFKEKKWCYGARDPIMKDIVECFLRMYKEGLVPPDYLTIATKSWEELMSTNRGFMTLEYVVRLDFFNIPNRATNPDYTLASMVPPKADTPTGQSLLSKTNLDFAGYCICNTGKQENINNAFKLLDWMYSDEGSELLSWGKEGETYEVVDGQRKFILKDGETPRTAYGTGTYGLYQRIEVEANEAIFSKEQAAESHKTINYLEQHANPVLWLPLNNEEEARAQQLKPELETFVEENLSKFLLGQKPMSEWDKFQQELNQGGVDELISIYDGAYRRIMGDK